MPLEQEVKLVWESVEAARRTVITAGGRLEVSRRLLRDALFDTPDRRLGERSCALRVRRDGERAILTYKGPMVPGPVKTREEVETGLDSADRAETILRALGFQPWFVSEKYREEYLLASARVMVDETPIGVFIEIEASPAEIEHAARLLGKTPADYRLESYPRLFFEWCTANGSQFRDMTFANPGRT